MAKVFDLSSTIPDKQKWKEKKREREKGKEHARGFLRIKKNGRDGEIVWSQFISVNKFLYIQVLFWNLIRDHLFGDGNSQNAHKRPVLYDKRKLTPKTKNVRHVSISTRTVYFSPSAAVFADFFGCLQLRGQSFPTTQVGHPHLLGHALATRHLSCPDVDASCFKAVPASVSQPSGAIRVSVTPSPLSPPPPLLPPPPHSTPPHTAHRTPHTAHRTPTPHHTTPTTTTRLEQVCVALWSPFSQFDPGS